MMHLQITSNANDVAARLAEIPALIDTALFDAMGRSLDESQNEAIAYNYATFMNPSGELEGEYEQTIEVASDGVQGQLSNPSNHAWRQEEGFSGMTDSIGRYFSHTPEYHFMEHTLEVETPNIEQIFTDSLGQALSGIGG